MESATTACYFEGCRNVAEANSWRCAFHRGRERCSVPDCRRQAYAKKLCARHGGKSNCSMAGCPMRARSMGLCAKHGVKRTPRMCRAPNCSKPAQARGHCVRHDSGRRCKIDGCKTYARKRGLCCRHSNLKPTTAFENELNAQQAAHIELCRDFLGTDEAFKTELIVDPVELSMLELLIQMQS
ncbi:hypothetical protein LEN26_012929 [Aphanomyces euteiches]|nr:hypothetical protein LEN26_012929 [Aphanomyces euteiches]KAH9126140.1 hypothetical protein AeMF1_003400 [Aphanomyces euteiches]KAH9182800.1 hypothetical protein AeNC1_015224 [Aphanomyces euteiches]